MSPSRAALEGRFVGEHREAGRAAGLVGGCTVIGLALVPDAPGKLPKTLRRSADVVASAAPAVWSLPWVPDLRVHTADDLAPWSPAEPDPAAAR